jgi:hypothetical protein
MEQIGKSNGQKCTRRPTADKAQPGNSGAGGLGHLAEMRGKMTRMPNPRGDRTAKARVASLKARRKQANERAADVAPIITALQTAGATSLNGVARALNMRGSQP